jgi:hypothetical protein
MRSQRLSRTITGNPTLLISNPTVDQPTSDAPLPTQDGGNSSNTKDQLSLTREERFLKLLVKLMVKTKTSVLTHRLMKFTNSGIFFTLMNGRENQLKENLMKDSDYMLKEISTLCQLSQIRDTLT